MNGNKCYLCERTCYMESASYADCEYRRKRSFGCLENRMYETACTKLAEKFGRKHGWRFEGWTGYFDPQKCHWNEGAGGWAYFSNDEVVDMESIRADLLMDADPNAYGMYMDESAEEYERAEAEGRHPMYVNYRNWLLGKKHGPQELTEDDLMEVTRRLERVREDLVKQVEELQEQLREQAQKDADDLLVNSDGIY